MKRPRWMVTQWEDCSDPSAATCCVFILNALRDHILTFPKNTAPFNRRTAYELPHREKRRKLFH